jgi:hypothetical protein
MTGDLLVLFVLLGCSSANGDLEQSRYEFVRSDRLPSTLSNSQVADSARAGLSSTEGTASVATYQAEGIGQTVVQVVVADGYNPTSFVVDEDGKVALINLRRTNDCMQC